MEAKIAALDVRVGHIEERVDKHERDDERIHKYNSHMLEDVQARLAGIERTGARFESDLMHRSGRDSDTQKALNDIFDRLRQLERIAWIAMGGAMAVGALATFFGWQILKTLTH